MRTSLIVLAWVVATAAATGLAWAGVRSVVTEVAAPLPDPVSTTIRDDGPDAPDAPDGTTTTGSERPAPADTGAPAAPGAAEASVRTFTLTGGSATVRFSPAGAEVLSAVPASGFSADVEPEDRGIRVEFESDTHRSRLDVWWDGGPRHRIDEAADDDDGDDDRDDHDGGDDHDD